MTESRLRIGVTGASGFIGRHAVAHLASRGHTVLALQRPAALPPPVGVTPARFEMPGRIDPGVLAGLDVLIHAAVVEYSPAHRDADRVNREAADQLLAIAKNSGLRIVFLSTMSAHDGAESHYGRCKLELERRFDPARDCVLRLGLVLGNGGLFGSLVELIRGSSVIPLVGGGSQPIQTLWMGDLLDVLERVATRGIAGRFEIATSEVYTMRRLYETVIEGLGVRRTLVPVPLPFVQIAVATLELLRIPFSIHSENVLGLKQLRAFDNAGDLAALEVRPLSLEDSVRRLLVAS